MQKKAEINLETISKIKIKSIDNDKVSVKVDTHVITKMKVDNKGTLVIEYSNELPF